MAVYVMSDIHGRLDLFHQMLEKIEFSDQDTMYIIGDVIDRGPDGIPLLQEIMHTPNITMLLGNHELMMLDYYSPGVTEVEISRWNRNRNLFTLLKYEALSPEEQEEILDFLKRLPDCMGIKVGEIDFWLVHGFPGSDTEEAVWNRPAGIETPNPLPDRQLIVGHTPVPLLLCRNDQEEEAYFRKMEMTGDHVRILFAPGYIDIDCGCGHSVPGASLGCLRLDDFSEFYIRAR